MGSNSRRSQDATTRAERKAKKRKLEDAIPDVPGNGNDSIDAVEAKERQAKKVKKQKEKEEGNAEEEILPAAMTEGDMKLGAGGDVDALLRKGREVEASRKSKKERKAEKKAKMAEKAADSHADENRGSREDEPETGHGGVADGGEVEPQSKKKSEDTNPKTQRNNRNRDKKRKEEAAQKQAEGKGKDPRFIVFIGNLPFTATKQSVEKHFASVKPKAVRHLTQKDNPSKSKGIAFVEFEGYDSMKTCLKLFHHSTFDDGLSVPRKINVELTAGGGGNTKDRRAKIQQKNAKLNEERGRRIQEEEKAKWEKKNAEGGAIDESAIHPSRRGRVPGAL